MPDADPRREDLRRQFEASISGLELSDLRQLAGDLLLLGAPTAAEPVRPRLRRPPRAEPAAYRLRVDLDRARPPIWRRLDVRSDVTLDVLHQVLQTAFGWTDSHLHRFSLGGGPFDNGSELFLCPYDVEEPEDDGTAAAEVRLDEVVQEPDDVLHYVYDYGDSWELTLRLEAVLPLSPGAPTALCVDGRRAGPPEDCGGLTHARDLLGVLDDPAHLDIDEVNQSLREPFFVLREAGVHPDLVDLVHRLHLHPAGDDIALRALALVAPAPEPTAEDKRAALQAHLWFLDRAGGEGLELTAAGYLRPVDVEAASAVVPTMADWIGKNNREVQSYPLLEFRESLQRLGLLRKRKGRLLLTRVGAQAVGDPTAVWQALAGRLLPAAKDRPLREAALLVLLHVATSTDGTVDRARVASAVSALGWHRGDGGPLEPPDVWHLVPGLLDSLSNVTDRPASGADGRRLSPAASALARTALRPPAHG